MRSPLNAVARGVETSARDSLVARLAAAFERVLVPTRLGRGFSRPDFDELIGVLRDFDQEWQEEGSIPKAAVGWFLDAHELLRSSAKQYPAETRREIERAAGELGDALRRAVHTS